MAYVRIPIHYNRYTVEGGRAGVVRYVCDYCGHENLEVVRFACKAVGASSAFVSDWGKENKLNRLKGRAERSLDSQENWAERLVNRKRDFSHINGNFVCKKCGKQASFKRVPRRWFCSLWMLLWLLIIVIVAVPIMYMVLRMSNKTQASPGTGFLAITLGITLAVILIVAAAVPILYLAVRRRRLAEVKNFPEYIYAEDYLEKEELARARQGMALAEERARSRDAAAFEETPTEKRSKEDSSTPKSDGMAPGNKEDGEHLPNKAVPAPANVGVVSDDGSKAGKSSNLTDVASTNGEKTVVSGKLDIKFPLYIVSETGKVLYTLEHRILRDQFYQNPGLVVRAALSKEDFLYDLYCFVAKYEGQPPELGQDSFKMSLHRQNSDINLIMFEFPEPMFTPLCFRIYLFYSDDFSKLGYYTIERGLSGGAILCEWRRDTHANYGEAKGAIWPKGREEFFKALEAVALIELFAKRYGLSKEAEKPYAPSGREEEKVSERTDVRSEGGLLPEENTNFSNVKEEEGLRKPNNSENSDGRNGKKAPLIQRAGDLE